MSSAGGCHVTYRWVSIGAVRIVDKLPAAVDASVDEAVDDAACPGDNLPQVVDILGMTKQF
jgi:hypothetical protein